MLIHQNVTRMHEMWQTDFTYFRMIKRGWPLRSSSDEVIGDDGMAGEIRALDGHHSSRGGCLMRLRTASPPSGTTGILCTMLFCACESCFRVIALRSELYRP